MPCRCDPNSGRVHTLPTSQRLQPLRAGAENRRLCLVNRRLCLLTDGSACSQVRRAPERARSMHVSEYRAAEHNLARAPAASLSATRSALGRLARMRGARGRKGGAGGGGGEVGDGGRRAMRRDFQHDFSARLHRAERAISSLTHKAERALQV